MSDAALDRFVRPLITPEGVDLQLRLATASERAGAFLLDMAIIVAALIALSLGTIAVVITTRFSGPVSAYAIIWLIGFFFLRNFYFTWFESRPRAASPGKRMLGLRVAARTGGRLTAEAAFARNAMREIEVFIPATMLFTRGVDMEALAILAGIVWCGVFVLFPLFNRDRLRVGDVVAGTWVVRSPRQKLLDDVVEDAARPAHGAVFSDAQLNAYGVHELQVLEDVLRAREPAIMAAVAERIRLKIGARDAMADEDFLAAYYAALRGRLEHRLLLGVRKRDKHDER
jgi:uncharacterized RDD family membrane protein YckC